MIGTLEEIFAARGHPLRCRDCPAAAQHFTVVHGWRWIEGRATYNRPVLCPDLLRYEQIGEADGLRGRIVRGFFFVLRIWPPVEASRPRSAWFDG